MKLLNKLKCWYYGHDMNPYDNDCIRCEKFIDYDEAVKPWAKIRIENWVRRKKEWFKCPDCGWRFGRHDENIPHMPF